MKLSPFLLKVLLVLLLYLAFVFSRVILPKYVTENAFHHGPFSLSGYPGCRLSWVIAKEKQWRTYCGLPTILTIQSSRKFRRTREILFAGYLWKIHGRCYINRWSVTWELGYRMKYLNNLTGEIKKLGLLSKTMIPSGKMNYLFVFEARMIHINQETELRPKTLLKMRRFPFDGDHILNCWMNLRVTVLVLPITLSVMAIGKRSLTTDE